LGQNLIGFPKPMRFRSLVDNFFKKYFSDNQPYPFFSPKKYATIFALLYIRVVDSGQLSVDREKDGKTKRIS